MQIALTNEQQKFAAENHSLVGHFLRKKKLDENTFYDEVIFAFLQAVIDYSYRPSAKNYPFEAFAFRSMTSAVNRYWRKKYRRERIAPMTSLERMGENNDEYSLADFIAAHNAPLLDFETELLLLEIQEKVSPFEFNIIRLKMRGYQVKEIASMQNVPLIQIQKMLTQLQGTIESICYK